MLYARSQSACRLLYFREASEKIIIVVRFFVRLYSPLLYPIYFSVRPYYTLNGQINAHWLLIYVCVCVCRCVRACLCLQSYEQADVFSSSAYTSVEKVRQQQSRRWANERKDKGKEENTFSEQAAVVVVVAAAVTVTNVIGSSKARRIHISSHKIHSHTHVR